MHNEGRFNSVVVQTRFTTGKWSSVISHDNNHRIVKFILSFQFLHNLSYVRVKPYYFVGVLSEVFAGSRIIHQIRRNAHIFRICGAAVFVFAPTTVSVNRRKPHKKWFTFGNRLHGFQPTGFSPVSKFRINHQVKVVFCCIAQMPFS